MTYFSGYFFTKFLQALEQQIGISVFATRESARRDAAAPTNMFVPQGPEKYKNTHANRQMHLLDTSPS